MIGAILLTLLSTAVGLLSEIYFKITEPIYYYILGGITVLLLVILLQQ